MSLPVDHRRDTARTTPASALDEKHEVDLSTLLDLQDRREESQAKHSNQLILKSCAGLLILLLVWYAASASNRKIVDGLIQNLRESTHGRDTYEGPETFAKRYDQIMDQLGSHSVDIDHATQSLGVDPTTVEEDGMDTEMKSMMGGEGRTSGERKRMVDAVANLAGVELPKPHELPTTPVEAVDSTQDSDPEPNPDE